MTYHELVDKVRTALVAKADASKVEEHIAVQVNVTGEAEGKFYIEIKDGEFKVEPYDYNDHDFLLTCDGAEILAVAQGKKTLETAIINKNIAHEGDWEKTVVLSGVIPVAEKAEKKTAKKAAVKAEEEAPEEGQLAFSEDPEAKEEAAPVEVKAEEPAPAEVKAEETAPVEVKAEETAPVEVKAEKKPAKRGRKPAGEKKPRRNSKKKAE